MKQILSLGLTFLCSSGLYADTKKTENTRATRPKAQQTATKTQTLYQLNGKAYTTDDLTPAMKQAVYDTQMESYETLKSIVDNQILEAHVNETAKKQKKTVEEVEKKLFQSKEVKEPEAKKWFEENKARLGGREFDTIKSDIIRYLQSMEDQKNKTKVLEELKKKGKFEFAMQEPQVPIMQINSAGFPSKGKENAKVTIVEFADYQCGHCKAASKSLKALVEKYKDKVRFVYMDFPIDHSGVTKKVAEGGVCANKQNVYWDYHYLAYESGSLSKESPMQLAKEIAKTSKKFDVKKFESCLASKEATEKVEFAKKEGERLGISGTPTVFFNGRRVMGYEEKKLEEVLKSML